MPLPYISPGRIADTGTDSQDENSPLLTGDQAVERHPDGTSCSVPQLLPVGLAVLTLVIVTSGEILQTIPLNQVLENIICRNVYAKHEPDGQLPRENCQNNQHVQSELAFLRGWQATFDLIPGIISAIPYGVMTDKYGRKPILCLGLVGMMLTQGFYMVVCLWPDVFPVRLTWLSPIFTLIGGGPVVLNGIIYSVISDLAPAAYRSNIFFYMGGSVLSAELASSPVAVALMNVHLWLPIFVGFVLYLPSLLVASYIPETLHFKATGDVPPSIATEETERHTTTIWGGIANSLGGLRSATAFFDDGNGHIVALLSTILLITLGRHAQDIILQFARRRYGWTWGQNIQAGLLLSLRAGVLVVLLLLLLPACITALTKWSALSTSSKDLLLARTSCAILLLGAVIIGLSINGVAMVIGFVVYSLGSGYSMVLRSLLAAMVDSSHLGALFNTVGILESIGALVAGPLLAASFRLGLEFDGVWIGLPFLVAAGLLSVAIAILLSSSRLRSTSEKWYRYLSRPNFDPEKSPTAHVFASVASNADTSDTEKSYHSVVKRIEALDLDLSVAWVNGYKTLDTVKQAMETV